VISFVKKLLLVVLVQTAIMNFVQNAKKRVTLGLVQWRLFGIKLMTRNQRIGLKKIQLLAQIAKLEFSKLMDVIICFVQFAILSSAMLGARIHGYSHFSSCIFVNYQGARLQFPLEFRQPKIPQISLTESRLGTVRKCASCGIPYKKSKSSNVVLCTNCSSMNCFICGHIITSLNHYNSPSVTGKLCLMNSPIANLEEIEKPSHENFAYVYSADSNSYSIQLTTKKALNLLNKTEDTSSKEKEKSICECDYECDDYDSFDDDDYNDEYDFALTK